MKKNRFVSMILALMLVAVTLTIPAMATEVGSGIASEIGNGSIIYVDDEKESGTNPWVEIWGIDDKENQVNIKGVTTDEVTDLIDRKGADIANILKHIGRVASIIGFFVSIICIIIGAIGNRRMMTGGFIGLLASALAYTALNYGKELLEIFSMWIVS